MVTQISVNIGSGSGLVPDITKHNVDISEFENY